MRQSIAKTAGATLFTSNLQEIEIYYRNRVPLSERPKIGGSRDAYEQFRAVWSPHIDRVEEFMVMVLNRSNRVLGWSRISQGGISGTVADPKVIFQIALKANGSSLILAHNHPSGNLQPSEADIHLTRKIQEAGKMLDLPLLDHIILTSEGFYSFADEGLI